MSMSPTAVQRLRDENDERSRLCDPTFYDFQRATTQVSLVLTELSALYARIYPHMWGSSDGIWYICPWCKHTVSALEARLGVYCEARHQMGGDALD